MEIARLTGVVESARRIRQVAASSKGQQVCAPPSCPNQIEDTSDIVRAPAPFQTMKQQDAWSVRGRVDAMYLEAFSIWRAPLQAFRRHHGQPSEESAP